MSPARIQVFPAAFVLSMLWPGASMAVSVYTSAEAEAGDGRQRDR